MLIIVNTGQHQKVGMSDTGEDFTMINKKALREVGWQRAYSATATNLLLGLTSEADRYGQVHMTVKMMAERMGIARQNASGALNELIRAGMVDRGDMPHSYILKPGWLRRPRITDR